MKNLILIILLFFSQAAIAQMCDSSITHDTTSITTVTKYRDSSYNITVSVKHDTTIYVKQKRWFIFTYYKLVPVVVPTTHDSSYKVTVNIPYNERVNEKYRITHDTLVPCPAPPSAPAEPTVYGSLAAHRDSEEQLNALRNLGVTMARNSVILSIWSGNCYAVDFWKQNGFDVFLNINNDFPLNPFPKDLRAYRSKIKSYLNLCSGMEIVAIENEEMNPPTMPLGHYGSLQDYVNELEVAIEECHLKGVQITNGGLTLPIVASIKAGFIKEGKTDSAMWLANAMGGISTDPVTIAKGDTLLSAYKRLNLDFVNLHWYEPKGDLDRLTGALEVIIDKIEQRTGKRVITNETGVKSDNTDYVKALLKAWKGAKYVVIYDSNGIGVGGAYPFTDANGIPVENGQVFKTEIIQSEY